ncbi:STAS-like domain-containing protein [Membranihabitans marinus]|uniref:STAS-like domain-containing protein n=1 Tax=Membranihabitans marinus TaxID=1227546 RepID=UPI001F466923|nr:DUF4325 domain-containing protein [Membranihabitans marinus]
MNILILKDVVINSSSNEEGTVLFEKLEEAYLSNNPLILQVGSDMSMSSSFLNTSIGLFLEKYGLDNFKKTVKFKGSKNQFLRLSDYIDKFNELYLI